LKVLERRISRITDFCRRSVEANNGVVRVRDIPGAGCVITIDLPRHFEAIAN
jgi:hypothetical protein